jgi:DNA-binding beta-propeller fold protein YncE
MPSPRGHRKAKARVRACAEKLLAAAALASIPVTAAAQGAGSATSPPADPPTATYWVYVAAESADLIHRVRYGPDGATVEKTIPIGLYPTETEGPHGLMVSRDGRYLHMTTGHGLPDGAYWKFELGPDTVVAGPTALGKFPATLDVTPDGLYAFVVNFNLHGEMVPSTVSVVYTPDGMEVAQTTTCTMPHGARLSPDGTRMYSGCMMDDQLVEIETRTFGVSRRFSVAKGHEMAIATTAADAHAGHDMREMANGAMKMDPSCSPTWAQPSVKGDRIYVACNKGDEILDIDTKSWTLKRKIPTGRGPYNLGVTPDGRLLVASLKPAASVEFYDLATGKSLAVTPSSTKVTHGVAISPDSRYAFVSVEGIGAEPGKVDIFDLRNFQRVASVEVGQQAGGIAFWKMEKAKPGS